MVKHFSKGRIFLLLLILTSVLTSCTGPSTTLTSAPTPTPSLTPTRPPQSTIAPPTYAPVPITWESMNGPSGGRISKLIQNPFGRHELYALSAHGVHKSEDKGENWQLIEKTDVIGTNAMDVYKDRLFIAGHSGIYCYKTGSDLEKILNNGAPCLMVSDNKLFVTIMTPQQQPYIFYTDLASEKYQWHDISPSTSEMSDLRLPKNPSLWHHVSARNIVALGNRILANIAMEIEGSGIETNGGLYVSEDLGESWSKVILDVPEDVIIANIVQDPRDTKHIFLLVNRQGKWDTFETKVNGHFRACSYSGKALNYHAKGGVSHGATDHRPILAS